MSTFDEQIKHALRDESDHVWQEVEEQGLFEQALGVMRGRWKFWAIWVYVVMFAMFAFAILACVRLFTVESTRDQIAWAVGFIFAMQAVGMLKLWFWLQMDKNAVIREVKRLELQVATLAGILKKQP